jgi:hypothetical protein
MFPVFPDFVDVGDVGVIERGGHLRLAKKAGARRGIGHALRGKDLEREIAPEALVAGAIECEIVPPIRSVKKPSGDAID